jgi:hypothetical protein
MRADAERPMHRVPPKPSQRLRRGSGNIVNVATAAVPSGMTDPTPANNAATSAVSVAVATLAPIPTLDPWLLACLSVMLIVLGSLASERVKQKR